MDTNSVQTDIAPRGDSYDKALVRAAIPAAESHLTDRNTAGGDVVLRGWPLAVAWAAWLAVSAVAVGLIVSAYPSRWGTLFEPSPETRAALAQKGMPVGMYTVGTILHETLIVVGFVLVAGIIVSRKPNTLMGLLVSLMLLTFGICQSPAVYLQVDRYPQAASPLLFILMLSYVLLLVFFCVFPDGRFVPRWTRYTAVAWSVWLIFSALWPSSALSAFSWPLALTVTVAAASTATGLAAQVYRYFQVSSPIQKRQTRWIVFGFLVAMIAMFGVNVPEAFIPAVSQPGREKVVYDLVRSSVSQMGLLLILVSIAVALLRYHLWDIDLIINRTLVYVPLTSIVAGLYSASITLFQKLFVAVTGEQSDTAIVLTVLIVAATFTPVKNGLQSFVDKHFKPVLDPAKQVKEFGDRLRGGPWVIDVEQFLSRAIDLCVAAFHATGGAIYVDKNGFREVECTSGEWRDGDAEVNIPLKRDGVTVGTLQLSGRRSGLSYTGKDIKILENMADLVVWALERSASGPKSALSLAAHP